jgi:diaminohydroxyphosphoribosylaminopyrimidine deaminase/5-amino-6-(5-phosphoribosylamino)uracil reductase
MKKDEIYMKAAVKNAMKAKGMTGVNPLVGCVIVKNNRIISEGRHEGPGFAHAEIIAINSAFESLKDSTIYITLEPCNTWGKTPPCVETIEQIPFKRIVIGAEDPNPLVSGKSIKRLEKKGYDVTVGVLEDEVNAMNPYFKDYISRKKTYIIIKAALTLDGYLNVNGGESKYFTCEESRTLVHEERFKTDAILVGSNTVNTDNPILDCRLTKKRYSPSLIILDFSNKLDYSKNIISDSKRKKYIFVSEKFKNHIKSEKNIKYFFVKRKESVWKILKNEFYRENIISIYVEGGADVFSGAIKSGLIDEMQVFYAPILSGGGKRIELPKPAMSGFVLSECKKIKNDLYARYLCSQD